MLGGAVVGVPIALFLIREQLALKFDLPIAKRFLGFGYPFIYAGLAYWMLNSLDKWMLIEWSSETQLGLYSIAAKFAGVALAINAAFGQAWSPNALKMRAEDRSYRDQYSRVLSIWCFFLALVGTVAVLFGHEALRLLTPKEYWTAAPAIAPLVMGVVLFGTTQITAIGISLENRTELFAKIAWLAVISNGLLNFVLIPRFGAVGASVATFLSYLILTGSYLAWSQKLHPIPLRKISLLYSVAIIIIMTFAGLLAFDLAALSLRVLLIKCAIIGFILVGGIVVGVVDRNSLHKFVRRMGSEV
jgi:O-antigen/teichoic acid export membrane protein